MALPNLTDQNIQDTYQRVLQTDGIVIYDGTGSIFLPVSASYSITASYAEYAVSASHEIIKEVSSSYADYAKESGLSTSSISASYASTASYALNSPDTFPYTGSAIISGSLTVTGSAKIQYLTASGLNYPITDGDEKQLIITDGGGNLSFDWSDRTNLDVKNTSGVSLPAGTPVYLTGFQGASIFQIAAASSSISSTMPAIGVLDTDLNPNDQGHATLIGAVRNINTSTPGYSINQSLYVGEGVLTPNRPTGSAQIQKIARVGKVANNGEITILGAGRTNDIPNLQPGYTWVGDSTWNAVATPTSSFNEDPFPYTGSAVISGSLDVVGNVSASTYYGDGSNLSGISSTPFPFEGDAIITGSFTVSGSIVDFTSASSVNINLEDLPLINPIVEYLDITASIASGTTLSLPNNLSYISSSTYEYLEIFMNGLRIRYDRDFVPMSNTTIQTQIAFPSGSELTFKSLRR